MSTLDATLYVDRAPLRADFALDILRYLWLHGANFGVDDGAHGGTWQGLLQARGDLHWGRFAGKTFAEMVGAVVGRGGGYVPFYDRGAELRLLLDTDLAALEDLGVEPGVIARLPYGRVGVAVESFYLDESATVPPATGPAAGERPIPPHAYLLTPYQQIHYAVAHWVELLCVKLDPLFGFSYDTNGLARDEDTFYAHVDEAFMGALQRGAVPAVRDWVARPEILYASAALVSQALTREWLTAPGRWTRALPNGALLSYVLPMRDEAAIAEELVREGQAAWKAGEFRRAGAKFRHATAVFETLGDHRNARRCETLLAGIDRVAGDVP